MPRGMVSYHQCLLLTDANWTSIFEMIICLYVPCMIFLRKNTANKFGSVFILNPISIKQNISMLRWPLSYDKFVLLFFGNQYVYEVSMWKLNKFFLVVIWSVQQKCSARLMNTKNPCKLTPTTYIRDEIIVEIYKSYTTMREFRNKWTC